MRKHLLFTSILSLAASAALAQPLTQQVLQLTSGTTTLTVQTEIAASENARRTGLMNRESLCADCGMLLVWESPIQTGMWMRNTLIPLDMLFIRNGEVVGIHPDAKPLDETIILSPNGIESVLEVNAGWAARHQVGPGWRISLQPQP